ncbi:MAG TPA: efflux RND transporter periplasmic adaptor subunit [Phycisphaerae bacterium]
MTTTTSNPPSVVVSSPVRTPAVNRVQRLAGGRTFIWVAGFLSFGAVAWLGTSWLRTERKADAISVFTVSRRSFPVILPEKGELKAGKSVDIKSEVEGRSRIIWLIAEGTEVQEGDLLVKLASDEIEEKVRNQTIQEANATAALEAAEREFEILRDQNGSDIRKAELQLSNAQIDLQKYMKGDWEQAQLAADLDVKKAEKVLDRAKSDYADSLDLYEKKFIPKGQKLEDEMKLMEAEIGLQKARLALDVLEKYTHPKDKRQRESDVAEAEKELDRVRNGASAKEAKQAAELDARRASLDLTRQQLAKYRDQQSKTEIKAPAPGLVVYENSEGRRWDASRQIAEGNEVFERQTIIRLPDTSVMVVKVRIHEAKTDKIKPNQPARITVEALPGRNFTGKITKIAPLADSSNQWLNPDLKEYETEITIDQSDPNLKPGVTAQAEIIADEVQDELAIPTQSVFMKAGKAYVFRGRSERDAEPVEVTLGISSAEYVTVKSGLNEGDKVLLAVSDDLKRKLPEPPPGESAEAPLVVTDGGGLAPRGGGGRMGAPGGAPGGNRPPGGAPRPSGSPGGGGRGPRRAP